MALEVDYIVDLSNVCRNADLGAPMGGASLDCLELLHSVIAKSLNGRTPNLQYVADNNLWSLLNQQHGSARVNDWKQRKARVLFTDPLADRVILRLASTSGTKVISQDNFRDHRTDHPWLQDNSEDIVGWMRKGDDIFLRPRTIESISESEASRKSEEKGVKGANLDPGSEQDRRILGSLHQCENLNCELHKSSPSYLPIYPQKQRSAGNAEILVCPSCKKPVREIGFIGKVAQFKFKILDTGATGRITFTVDSTIIIGRKEILGALSEVSDIDREACAQVSGQHLKILVSANGVNVADNGSTNGTTISRMGLGGVLDSATVIAEKMVGFNHGDKLYLGEAVEVTRSGRKYGFANLNSIASEPAVVKTQVKKL